MIRIAKQKSINVVLSLTYRCNARCRWCDHMVNLLDTPGSDMTDEQIGQAIREMQQSSRRIRVLRLAGGEPTIHPAWRRIVERVHEELVLPGHICGVQINTNRTMPLGTIPDKGWEAVGRNLAAKNVKHVPFGLSPRDMGITPDGLAKVCRNQSYCGVACDYQGWTFCQIAPNLGRILGIDVFKPHLTMAMDPRVCEHCSHALPRWLVCELAESIRAGNIRCPSPTVRAGLLRDPHLRKPARHMLVNEYQHLVRRLLAYHKGPLPDMQVVEFATVAAKSAAGTRRAARDAWEFFGARFFDVGHWAINDYYKQPPGPTLPTTMADKLPWGQTDAVVLVEEADGCRVGTRRLSWRRARNQAFWQLHNANTLLRVGGLLAYAMPVPAGSDYQATAKQVGLTLTAMRYEVLEQYPTKVNKQPYAAAVARKSLRAARRRFPTMSRLLATREATA